MNNVAELIELHNRYMEEFVELRKEQEEDAPEFVEMMRRSVELWDAMDYRMKRMDELSEKIKLHYEEQGATGGGFVHCGSNGCI